MTDENMPYFTTIFVILFQTFFFLLFSVKTPRSQCLPILSKKVTSLSIFFSWWLYGKYLVGSKQTFLGNFDYFMSKLTTFNQSAVLCLCWSSSALLFFLSTNTQLLRAVEFAGALSFQLAPLAHFHILVLKIVNISKNSSKWQRFKINFLGEFNFQSNQVRNVDYTILNGV